MAASTRQIRRLAEMIPADAEFDALRAGFRAAVNAGHSADLLALIVDGTLSYADAATLVERRSALRRAMRARTTGAVRAVGRAIAGNVGFRETLLFAALGCLAWGLAMVWAPAALVVPGAALFYVAVFGVK